MHGLTAPSGSGQKPAMKPTGIMTNCDALQGTLARKCDESHEHQPLVSGRAAGCAKYTDSFCDAVLRGVRLQLKSDMEDANLVSDGVNNIDEDWEQEPYVGDYVDDVSGKMLDKNMVCLLYTSPSPRDS